MTSVRRQSALANRLGHVVRRGIQPGSTYKRQCVSQTADSFQRAGSSHRRILCSSFGICWRTVRVMRQQSRAHQAENTARCPKSSNAAQPTLYRAGIACNARSRSSSSARFPALFAIFVMRHIDSSSARCSYTIGTSRVGVLACQQCMLARQVPAVHRRSHFHRRV